MGRPLGSKNKKTKEQDMRNRTIFRIDMDVDVFLRSQKNMGAYINDLVRKDMEQKMKIKEMEESDMKKMNTYNFVENGCVFYHVIADSEEQCYSLAEGAGIDVTGMELELERMNVRDELGRPYSPRIEESLVH